MNPMNTIVLILAGILALLSLLLLALPDKLKVWFQDLSVNELRTIGIMILLIVAGAVYYALRSPIAI